MINVSKIIIVLFTIFILFILIKLITYNMSKRSRQEFKGLNQ